MFNKIVLTPYSLAAMNAQIKVDNVSAKKTILNPQEEKEGREEQEESKRNQNCRLTGEARHCNTYFPAKKNQAPNRKNTEQNPKVRHVVP